MADEQLPTPGAGPGIRKKLPAKRVKAAYRRYCNGAGGELSLRAWAATVKRAQVGDETYECVTVWLKRKGQRRN
jgi:hypothetical protein